MSEMSTFERVCTIVSEQNDLDTTDITEDTELSSLDIDSLDIIEIICVCEEEFGIEFDDTESLTNDVTTVGEFVSMIESLMEG